VWGYFEHCECYKLAIFLYFSLLYALYAKQFLEIKLINLHLHLIIMKTNLRERSTSSQCVIRPKVHFAPALSFKYTAGSLMLVAYFSAGGPGHLV